ncbi:MAG TPA: alpha/beta hydrolase, partial [Tissierellaceae bacterium]|nr:alpha/beta hydrolase [Tissierellaceae bacterium]
MEVVYKIINDNEEQLELEASLYKNNSIDSKGIILYFHGGGLVMGSRKDLPRYHIERLTSSGYPILSFDYRLAPEANFDQILSDVLDGIEYFINNKEKLGF